MARDFRTRAGCFYAGFSRACARERVGRVAERQRREVRDFRTRAGCFLPAPARLRDDFRTGSLCSRILRKQATESPASGQSDISSFFPHIDLIFPGEALNPFFGAQDEGFSEFRSR